LPRIRSGLRATSLGTGQMIERHDLATDPFWFECRRLRATTITTEDGVEIFYKDSGQGQPIVFGHDWPLSAVISRRFKGESFGARISGASFGQCFAPV
jgi:hypothetical protein